MFKRRKSVVARVSSARALQACVHPNWPDEWVAVETPSGLSFRRGQQSRGRGSEPDRCPIFAVSPPGFIGDVLVLPWVVLGPAVAWTSFRLPRFLDHASVGHDFPGVAFACDVWWGDVSLRQMEDWFDGHEHSQGATQPITVLVFSDDHMVPTSVHTWGDVPGALASGGDIKPHLIAGLADAHGYPTYEIKDSGRGRHAAGSDWPRECS